MLVWSLFLIFGFFAEKNIRTPKDINTSQDWVKDWRYFERFFHYSGIKFISRKFVPPKTSDRFPTGFIWLIGLYFAAYAFTAQRYENLLDKVEFKYTIFTTQVAAGAAFSNKYLMDILQENIPIKPMIYRPTTIYKSFLYGPVYFEKFYKNYKNIYGKYYQSADSFRQDIISQWSKRLEGANFRYAKFEWADFKYAQLKEATFQDAYLERAEFWDAQLERVDFSFAKLKGADFGKAQIKGAKFDFADLEGTDFSEAHLEGVDFGYRHLERTNFKGAHLEGANFEEAHLEGANFERAFLEEANFGSAQLKGASFLDAKLERVIFKGTQLEDADFGYVRINGAEFEGAQLKGAKFESAQLKGVIGLTAQQLIKAKNICGIQDCPQNILEGIKKYGCIEMLEHFPSRWSKQFIEYHKNLISQWTKENSK